MDRRKSAIMTGRGTTPDGSKVERRKSSRFLVAVPIEASWRNADGVPVLVQAIAKQVNANGGFLEMTIYPGVGSRITPHQFSFRGIGRGSRAGHPEFAGKAFRTALSSN